MMSPSGQLAAKANTSNSYFPVVRQSLDVVHCIVLNVSSHLIKEGSGLCNPMASVLCRRSMACSAAEM
jgi:hypothetical protein